MFLITVNSSSCLHVVTSLLYSLAFGIIGGGHRFFKNVGATIQLQAGDMEQGAKSCSGSLRPTEMCERMEFVPLRTNSTQLPIDRN
jgi:hypothetical protein